MKTKQFAASLLLIFFNSVSYASNSEIARCRTFEDATKRLSCYDDIDISIKATRPVQETIESFGQQKRAASTEIIPIAQIESELAGDIDGWRSNDLLRLINGQTWQIVDGSDGVFPTRIKRVSIRRGLLGSYYIEFENMNISVKVRRIK